MQTEQATRTLEHDEELIIDAHIPYNPKSKSGGYDRDRLPFERTLLIVGSAELGRMTPAQFQQAIRSLSCDNVFVIARERDGSYTLVERDSDPPHYGPPVTVMRKYHAHPIEIREHPDGAFDVVKTGKAYPGRPPTQKV